MSSKLQIYYSTSQIARHIANVLKPCVSPGYPSRQGPALGSLSIPVQSLENPMDFLSFIITFM